MYHKGCNHEVTCDSQIHCFSSFNITDSGIKPIFSSVEVKEKDKIIFLCEPCDKFLEKEDIIDYCSHCQEEFDVDKLFKVRNIGGIYCNECRKTHFEGKKYQVVSNLLDREKND